MKVSGRSKARQGGQQLPVPLKSVRYLRCSRSLRKWPTGRHRRSEATTTPTERTRAGAAHRRGTKGGQMMPAEVKLSARAYSKKGTPKNKQVSITNL